MTNSAKISGTYWDILRTAEKLLAEGNFSAAERHHDVACSRREKSPGRVFLTEKISDGLGRFLKRNATADKVVQGRWERHLEEFRRQFLIQGDLTVRQAVHLAELRPEDDAEANQPILEHGLYLVGRSRLFTEEPASAVPMLKGVFRTAKRTGRPFPVDLIRHDLPLTEEDRLWLARRGGELVVEFQEQGAMASGTQEAEEWARVCLQLLNPRYFGQTGRLEEERSWVEAITADHLLGRAAESVEAYRNYLAEYPAPGPRADEARVRLLELLANIDGLHFQVPNYDEALAAMQSAGLSPDSAMAIRFETALARIEYRCPDPEPGKTQNSNWASLALETDGRVAAVLWWEDQPRDLAYWRPGEDPTQILHFLEPCEDRLICGNQATVSVLDGAWDGFTATWTVRDFAAVLLEVTLPQGGLDTESLLRIGMGETAAWRSSWHPDHGHVHLEPPRRSTLVEAWQGGPAGSSLVTGLLLLAIQTRLATADPCLRAGIRQLARRGDPASGFLYEFLTVGREVTSALDSTFEPWTLPLLWTRPDPFGWTSQGAAASETGYPPSDTLARPDLGRNDLAIVSTGDPASVVAAWGNGRQKWRIVLDRLDRLESLSRVAGGAIGPVTLIPQSGMVHDLDAALGLLEKMLTAGSRPSGAVDGLLPIFHWVRLVETHNGDLLDFQEVRPRQEQDIPLYDEYRRLVEDLPRQEPKLGDDARHESWAGQFSQRVRKAGFVAGMVDSLVSDATRLDSLWGVFEGSDASWVFLDSAFIHWSLLGRETAGIQELHALLHSRGRRHLSLLTGAIWLRSELEELLGTWLGVFGNPYCVGLTDGRPPRLRLADRGVVPDSRLDPVSAFGGQLAHVRQCLSGGESCTILLPSEGLPARFWRDVASGELLLAEKNLHFLGSSRQSTSGIHPDLGAEGLDVLPREGQKTLLVPVLASLEGGVTPIALEDSLEAWAAADRNRDSFLNWRRKLCGLEMASLLSGTWENVDILDPRWWRLLRPEFLSGGPESSPQAATLPWSGSLAASLVSPVGCATFHLPGSAMQPEDLLPTAIREKVEHWVGELPGSGAGEQSGLPVSRVSSFPVPQARLLMGNPLQEWEGLTRQIGLEWEQGRLSSWILLVADHLPGPAADLVSSSWTPGVSTWTAETGARLPGPVLWVTKEYFSHPEMVEYLELHPPTMVMACSVQQWLPGLGKGSQVGAHALRILLSFKSSGVILQADNLALPWRKFLQAATGAELVGTPVLYRADDDPDQDASYPGDAQSLQCLRQLLTRLELVLPTREGGLETGRPSLVSAKQLVSVRWLFRLAGVSESAIRQGIRILSWAGRLQGDFYSAASGQIETSAHGPGTHALLIPHRYALLEHLLKKLESLLRVLFPLLLGSRRPGLSTWIDLASPPVESDPEELLLLDCFLSMVAGSTVPSLGYDSPRGLMHTSRRILVCHGSLSETLTELVEALRLFQIRVKDIMSGAVETGEGFLVETGLNDLQAEERDFLSLGAAMGLWRWLGPVDDMSFHLVDLVTLAESPTVRERESGWQLLGELSTNRNRNKADGRDTGSVPGSHASSSPGWGLSGLRNLLPGNSGRQDDFTKVVQSVSALINDAGKPGMLVLKGMMGTGRHEAVAAALLASRAGVGVTIYCPDSEAAVVLLEAAGHLGAAFSEDIRIAEKGITPPPLLQFKGYLEDTPDNLIIMCEVQRFEKETRYRIAQMGRGRKLLMTIDPVSSSEPWENLFLTTPRAADIIELRQPRRSARKLWGQIRELVPEAFRGTVQTLRPEKGTLVADYAVNLDQCLARLVLDVESGALPDRLRLTGPLLSDLDFLADSIRQRGWLAVPENILSQLLLPGAREILALATDLLSRGIADAQAAGPVADPKDPDPLVTPKPVLLTSRLLAAEVVDNWQCWNDSCDLDLSAMTLAEFFAEVETQPWARSFLAHPQATERLLSLLKDWADESVSVLAETPLWEAWWLTILAQLGLKMPDQRRPLVTLAEASHSCGLFAPGGLYLCMGTEDWRQHYNVLARVTDQALILFKERSPLDDDHLPPVR
jgi:hypothetical protein